jgi:hypothetical protein
MGSSYIFEPPAVSAPAVSSITSQSGGITRISFTAQPTEIYVNDIIEVSGLVGEGWADMNGTHYVLSRVLGFKYIEIPYDSSGYSAYTGSMPTVTVKRGYCTQIAPDIASVSYYSGTALDVIIDPGDNRHILRPGDIVAITGATGTDADKVNGVIVVAIAALGPFKYILYGFTDLDETSINALDFSNAVLELPYGGAVPLGYVDGTGRIYPSKEITPLPNDTDARVLIDHNVSHNGNFYVLFSTGMDYMLQADGARDVRLNAAVVASDRQFQFTNSNIVKSDYTFIGMYFKMDDTGELAAGEQFVDLESELKYAALVFGQHVDEYGRVDVGTIRGAVPIAKTDIIAGDGSAIITREGRVIGTGGVIGFL